MSDDFTPDWLEAHRVDLAALRRDDVVGVGHALAEVDGLVARLRDPERAAAFGLVPPRGILFWGAPGLGKTLCARHFALRLGPGVPFYEVSADELTPERIRGTLRYLADAHPRSVLYADEIDTIGMARDFAGHDPDTRLRLTALLSALDGLRSTEGPVVIASSNRPPGVLDLALVRAGRLGTRVRFDPPDEAERVALWRLFARALPLEPEVDWQHLARLTRGCTPADLRQAAEDAAASAFAAGRPAVGTADLAAAARRAGRVEPEPEGAAEVRRRIAVHEAGHVAAAVALGEDVYAVRLGLTEGSTSYGDERVPDALRGDRLARNGLVIGLAGTEAERAVLGDASAGGASDVMGATQIAVQRVASGLSDSVPTDLSCLGLNVSEELKRALGSDVSGQMARARDRAREIVGASAAAIAAFAERLEVAGDLTGDELREAIAAAGFAAAGGES